MPIRLSKEPPKSRWVKYGHGVEFLIRPINSDVTEQFRKRSETGNMITDPKTRRQVPELNNVLHEELLRNYIIEDWKGVLDQDNNDVPCTPDAKAEIMKFLPISDFIFEQATLPDIVPEREKNSPAP